LSKKKKKKEEEEWRRERRREDGRGLQGRVPQIKSELKLIWTQWDVEVSRDPGQRRETRSGAKGEVLTQYIDIENPQLLVQGHFQFKHPEFP
jgi:hypothetical protein